MSNCTAADGEEVNMRVCGKHLAEAYVEAKRGFPTWLAAEAKHGFPKWLDTEAKRGFHDRLEINLRIEARKIAISGMIPMTTECGEAPRVIGSNILVWRRINGC